MRVDARKIEIIMAKKQLTRRKIAEIMGVSPACPGEIMRRQTTKPATVGRLASALGVSVEDILMEV